MAGKDKLRKVFHVPLRKGIIDNDDGTITVSGKFTSDQKDEIGDIITRAATERAIPKYRQWGNIRLMHQPIAVGKVLAIGEEDGLEWNEVQIKVVDPGTIRSVRHDLLPALSIGAMIRFEDIDFLEDGGWLINDYELVEISLVDHPANYDAKLDLSLLPEDFRDEARERGFVWAARSHGLPLVRADEEEATVEKSPPCRQEGESVEECVDRKVPELIDEGMDQDQAVAAAENMCSEVCSEDSLDPEEEKMAVQEETLPEVPVEVVSEDEVVETEKDLPVEEEAIEEPEAVEEEEDEEEEVPAPEAAEVEAEEEEEVSAPEVLDVEEPETIEEEEEIEVAEVEVSASEFSRFKDEVLEAITALATVVKAPAEAPQAEEQSESDADEADVDDVLEGLYHMVEELKREVSELHAEVDNLRKPANRKGAVRTQPVEEEEAEEPVVEEAVEPETEEDDDPVKATIRNYFRHSGRYIE